MTIVFPFMASVPAGQTLSGESFKFRILLYMIVKAVICLICIVLVKFVFSEPTNEKAMGLHEESMKMGIGSQIKLLLTDSTYNLFVFGPLISISMLGAADNHLFMLLAPFNFTRVRIILNLNS